MMRKRLTAWWLLIGWPAAILAGPQRPEIVMEPQPASIPAGRNQKPFDVTRHSIPLDAILPGGPPKDGIPALTRPAMVPAAEAERWLRSFDVVLGVEFGGVARAYPIRILNWHEVVNDDVGPQPVLITWCPLCGSGIVYDPVVAGQRHSFGVSGLLYQRNLLLYDHQTESLWSQLAGAAVTGPLTGASLRLLPMTMTRWEDWKRQHPATTVLSLRTGFAADYNTDPYRDWALDRRQALVVRLGGQTRIYPFSELEKAGGEITDDFAGQRVTIRFDARRNTATALGPGGERVPQFVSFLADARAFYPGALPYRHR